MAHELLKITTSTISFVTSIRMFLLFLFFGALTTLRSSVASSFQLREEDETRTGCKESSHKPPSFRVALRRSVIWGFKSGVYPNEPYF
jgi:hypothetical protein